MTQRRATEVDSLMLRSQSDAATDTVEAQFDAHGFGP